MPVPYTKPHLTYPQQLDLLKDRGLVIADGEALLLGVVFCVELNQR